MVSMKHQRVRHTTKLAMRQLEAGDKPTLTQADRVILKFNGARILANAIDTDISTVYKWTYTKAKQGCDGLIPSHAMKRILLAARREGVLLTADDLSPEPSVVNAMTR